MIFISDLHVDAQSANALETENLFLKVLEGGGGGGGGGGLSDVFKEGEPSSAGSLVNCGIAILTNLLKLSIIFILHDIYVIETHKTHSSSFLWGKKLITSALDMRNQFLIYRVRVMCI